MEKELYRVTTTLSGADEKSQFYFDTMDKAREFYADCGNGRVDKVRVTTKPRQKLFDDELEDWDLNYSYDGCTLNDLCYGDFSHITVDTVEDEEEDYLYYS